MVDLRQRFVRRLQEEIMAFGLSHLKAPEPTRRLSAPVGIVVFGGLLVAGALYAIVGVALSIIGACVQRSPKKLMPI